MDVQIRTLVHCRKAEHVVEDPTMQILHLFIIIRLKKVVEDPTMLILHLFIAIRPNAGFSTGGALLHRVAMPPFLIIHLIILSELF